MSPFLLRIQTEALTKALIVIGPSVALEAVPATTLWEKIGKEASDACEADARFMGLRIAGA